MSSEPWRAPWVSQISESLGLPPPVESIRVTHNGTNLLVTWDDAAAGANRYDVTTYDTGGHRNWRGASNPAGTSLFPQLHRSGAGAQRSRDERVAQLRAGQSGQPGGAPYPLLSIADATAAESSGSMAFTVSLSPAATQKVLVDYATRNGTATAGLDYTAKSGTLTFAAGETAKTVPVLADAHNEGSETFSLVSPPPRGPRCRKGRRRQRSPSPTTATSRRTGSGAGCRGVPNAGATHTRQGGW